MAAPGVVSTFVINVAGILATLGISLGGFKEPPSRQEHTFVEIVLGRNSSLSVWLLVLPLQLTYIEVLSTNYLLLLLLLVW